MALGFPFGFRVANPEPLDNKYGPYASTGAAIAAVLQGERYIGLTVNVAGVEYWWKDGVTDVDLILKTNGGGGGIVWEEIVADVVAQPDKGYITNNATKLNITLNTNYANKIIRIASKLGGWKVLPQAPHVILFVDEVINNSLESTLASDSVELLNVAPNKWQVVGAVGNLLFDDPLHVDFYLRAQYTPNAALNIWYRKNSGAWTLLDTDTPTTLYTLIASLTNLLVGDQIDIGITKTTGEDIEFGVGQNVSTWNTYLGKATPYSFVVSANDSKYLNIGAHSSGNYMPYDPGLFTLDASYVTTITGISGDADIPAFTLPLAAIGQQTLPFYSPISGTITVNINAGFIGTTRRKVSLTVGITEVDWSEILFDGASTHTLTLPSPVDRPDTLRVSINLI